VTNETRALGICLEECEYPYPVQFFPLVGAVDHVVPLGQYAKPEDAARLGDFVELSAAAARDNSRATRVVIPECGHIPHHEVPDQFLAEFLPFLAS
jgi:pimeloyl-ACP methyl ester carboxylesterase